jgi:transposase
MMGSKQRHFAPLIYVSREELVPADHFSRHLEQTLDLSFGRACVQETYAGKGRPSIDPVVFWHCCTWWCFLRISEPLASSCAMQRIAESVRWDGGYDLDEPLPDHSTLSKIRQRYGLPVFRRFFEAIVEQWKPGQARLGQRIVLWFHGRLNANADLDSLTPRFAVEAREAIQEHLTALFAPDTAQLEKSEASSGEVPLPEPLPADPFCAGSTSLPVVLSEEQHEELAADNAARHNWIAQEGR